MRGTYAKIRMQRFAARIGAAEYNGARREPSLETQRRPRLAGGAVSARDICGGMHPGRFWNSATIALCYDDTRR